ncbi:sulfotransferase [Halomonas denitrificans]|nr:sulfotransferase [Halomonas denitrificans]
MNLFPSAVARAIRLWGSAMVSPFTEGRRLRGAVLLVLAWPLFAGLQLLHAIGFLLDDVFFRGWRRVDVERPVFVVGPPRSGTTHLHHVLSADERFTTFRTWECLFGLSVTARKLLRGAAAVDRAIGRPVGRLGGWIGRRWLADMDDVHPFALDAPEEDFLALMPVMQCFILVAVFPAAPWLWRIARLDEQPEAVRRAWARYYANCVRRHLHAAGPGARFLSKNASFTGSLETLLDKFPDAVLLGCSRDPIKTVPSQMSSLEPGLRAVGFPDMPDELRDRLADLLRFYYLHQADVAKRHPQRVALLDNHALRDRLAESVTDAFEQVGLEMTPQFAASLDEASRASRGFSSGHRYSLADYGLDEVSLRTMFEPVYARYRFGESARDGVLRNAEAAA